MRKIQLLLMLLITSVITFGQVGINTGNPNINAGLHISERIDPASTAAPDKFNGVIIQRYTTAERNTLSLGAAENGLTIYNKDTNCYDYWNGTSSKWSSICGKLGPSEFNVGSIDCSTDISLNGSYTTDTGLTTSEYIKIKVNITSPGSYDFRAYSSPDNGYYFSSVGEFATTGIKTVFLYGSGVPANAGTDIFVLTLNGQTKHCDDQLKAIVSKKIKSLATVKLGDITNTSYKFSSQTFTTFMNSWSNFGPLSSSTVRTDGSPMAPDDLNDTGDLSTIMSYDIIGMGWRNGNDITALQRSSLFTFANTPRKVLLIATEFYGGLGSMNNTLGLLNSLIGDITLTSADIINNPAVNATTGMADFFTSDPANDPFLKGIFGDVTGMKFADQASGGYSISKTKLSQSNNVQILAANGNSVSAFKVKNKGVFWVEDGAFFSSQSGGSGFLPGNGSSAGPDCYTPYAGVMGAKPIQCGPSSTQGTNSGGSIFSGNIIFWALQQLQ
ncbi:hypothetical protein [Chryseobacterium sp.]|uniref:hypothetical protein n=1 Tax=Chryseobacterium sp. TaxID=1871047 RepID=UPI0024E2303B|nr:hypothetical protein [Chryseobacterium sp.]